MILGIRGLEEMADQIPLIRDQLLRSYGTVNTGLFGQDLWWQSGNFISALATFFQLDPDYGSIHNNIFATTLSEAPGYGNYANFLNNWYDDEGWWGNAFLDVYDYTSDSAYLNQAITIYNDIVGGLGTPCGGIWWDKDHTYVAAISNGGFIPVPYQCWDINNLQ
jgi:hypothetical protein